MERKNKFTEEALMVIDLAIRFMANVSGCPNCPQCSTLAKEHIEYLKEISKELNLMLPPTLAG